jgi:arylsulfatase A-like enzyme
MNTISGLGHQLRPRLRPSVRFRRQAGTEPDRLMAITPPDALWIGAWFGVLAGLLELLVLAVRNQISGSVWLGMLRMNRHFGWMIPAADALIFLAAGLVVALVVRLVPGPGRWLAFRLPGFLAALALLLTVNGLHAIAYLSLAAALGHVLGRLAGRHERPFLTGIRRTLPVIVLIEAGVAAACSFPLLARDHVFRAPMPTPPGQAPPSNVLLIVLDTVRAQSLSLHGYGRETSPNLARLAERGVRFQQACSTAPWTFPSHASLFTGRWPHELKVGENRPLDATYRTLAEFLAARGFRTGGFVANTFFCNSWYGLARGFDRYEDFYDDDVAISWSEILRCTTLGQRLLTLLGVSTADHRVRKDAARINQDFLDWLSESAGQPFFAFLNYFDAHSPYMLPSGQQRRLGTPEPTAEEQATLQRWDDRPKQKISPGETRLIRDAYDECLAYLDDRLGRLFEELERRGLADQTLVILTSDHGEHLGEHGLFGHGKSLYAQETHVPLIVVPPRSRLGSVSRTIVREPVSLRDIPATILDLLSITDSSPFPGSSLARHWNIHPAPTIEPTSPAFSEVSLRLGVSHNPNRPPAWRGPMQAVAAGSRAYVRNASGEEELFDLQSDPLDEQNLVARPREREPLECLRALVRSVLESSAAGL